MRIKPFCVFLMLCVLMIITRCNNPQVIKGTELHGDEGKRYLAGVSEKRWKLHKGQSFYNMMCFTTDGSFRDQTDYKATFGIKEAGITINDFEPQTFELLEISSTEMKLLTPSADTLIYLHTEDLPNANNSALKGVTKKWLKGANNGTVWRGESRDYTYSFMNDGRFFDSNREFKEEKWSWVNDSIIRIGNGDYKVVRLTTLSLEIEMFESVVKLNFVGEASPNGRPISE